MHTARICFAMEDEPAKIAAEHFRGCQLLKHPLLEEAELPPSRDLIVIEDMGECALPSTTDVSTHPSQAEKNIQVGIPAARSFLKAGLTGTSTPNSGRQATMIVDLTCHTADFARAALQMPTEGSKLYYVGLARDTSEEEWTRAFLKDFLAENLLDGTIKTPANMTLPEAEIPADMRDTAVPLPNYHILVPCQKVKVDGLATLKTPDKLVATWGESTFSGEFWEVINGARATLPLDVPPANADKKREHDGTTAMPKAKIQKVEVGGVKKQEPAPEAKFIAIDDMPTPLTWEADMPLAKSKGQCSVVITIGSRVWLVNRGTKDVILPKDFVIAGFFKGKWWHKANANDQVRDMDLLYELQDANTMVQINNKVMTLGAAVEEKRATNPDVVIQYHKLKDSPMADDPKFFVCEREKSIYFGVMEIPAKAAVKDENGKVALTYDKLAGCIGRDKWSSPYSELVWVVKWSPTATKGLVPVRPVIVLTRDCHVLAGKALEITVPTPANAAPVGSPS